RARCFRHRAGGNGHPDHHQPDQQGLQVPPPHHHGAHGLPAAAPACDTYPTPPIGVPIRKLVKDESPWPSVRPAIPKAVVSITGPSTYMRPVTRLRAAGGLSMSRVPALQPRSTSGQSVGRTCPYTWSTTAQASGHAFTEATRAK